MAMIALPALVFLHQPPYGLFPEITPPQSSRTKQQIPDIIFETGTKPATYRHTEAVFLPVNDFTRDHACYCFLQDVLSSESPELEREGETGSELHEFLIQKRTSGF